MTTQQPKSTKEKLKARTIGVKILFIITGVIILIGFIAPYVHIEMDRTSNVKVFGFRNLRSFFYSLGIPTSLLVCSSLFLYATNYINESGIKKYFVLTSLLFCYNSFFQYIWIFWSESDLSRGAYYTSIAGLSLVFSFAYYLLYKFYTPTIIKLKEALQEAISFFVGAKKHVSEKNRKEYINEYFNALEKINEKI